MCLASSIFFDSFLVFLSFTKHPANPQHIVIVVVGDNFHNQRISHVIPRVKRVFDAFIRKCQPCITERILHLAKSPEPFL